MEYTKGEWKLHGLTIETHYSPNGHVIACMNDIGNKVQADAHLMTAAPAMYEALKHMGQFMAANYDDEGKLFYYIDKEWLDKRIKALAKAEGEGGK